MRGKQTTNIFGLKPLKQISNLYNRVLDFPKKISLTSPSKELQCFNAKKTRHADIQIQVTDFSDTSKSLIIKTPEKFEILENGLGENNFNILGKGGFGTVVTGIYKSEFRYINQLILKKFKL